MWPCPWSVLDSPAYARLGHPGRSLLIEMARQYVRDNNGRLLASASYLAKRGWNSADVISRAKRQLLDAGFIFETVKGHRPNKASWYAVTWHALDRLPGYDCGAALSFVRSAYLPPIRLNGAKLSPSYGTGGQRIVPSRGLTSASVAPSAGAINANCGQSATPSPGHHLDMPSAPVSQAKH